MNREEFLKVLNDNKIVLNDKIHSMYTRDDFYRIRKNNPEIIEYVLEFTKDIETENLLERFSLAYYNMKEIPKCKTCGVRLPFKLFKHPYRTFCPNINCHKSKKFDKEKFNKSREKNIEKKIKIFNEWLKNPYRFDDEEGIEITALNMSKLFKRKGFFFNILFDTKDLLALPEIFNDVSSLEIPRRYYHLINKMNDIPKCEICGEDARFYNSVKGYSNTCESFECERERIRRTRRLTTHKKLQENLGNDLVLLDEYIDRSTNLLTKCNVCGGVFYFNCWNGSFVKKDTNYCPHCDPFKYRSRPEAEICDFIQSYLMDETIICNSRNIIGKGKELDIYIPKFKLAIEYNGVRWHGENGGLKDRNYHKDKLELCNKKDIQLIQVQSNEWIQNKEIVQSILLSKLNIFDRKIYARKCSVKEIDSKLKDNFLNENHLQGVDKSSIKLGLFYNDELVSVMTFGKRKITKGEVKLELIRYCSKKFVQVVGGASKLLSYFKNNFKWEEIITYADRRYSNGNFYEKIGFDLSHISQPNYYYFKHEYITFHRSKFMKHKLINILEEFDENKTEWENMKQNGYDRIWDCGHFVYKLKKK
ncbi:MAG: hypothetical protein RBT49_04570 [Bacteroidales bacterium]|jgi:hypothetical protein|nr:hypothetical protein [Bacteroidales bacterium]